MVVDITEAQGSRRERVTAAVSEADKERIKVVAAVRRTDVSNLLWSMSVTEILAEYDRLGGADPAA